MKLRKILALGVAVALTAAMIAACGGSGTDDAQEAVEDVQDAAGDAAHDVVDAAGDAAQDVADAAGDAAGAAQEAVEGAIDLSGYDFSTPDVTIAYEDFDAMSDLASSIQNGQAEGTIVSIDGVVMHPMTSYSIGEPGDGRTIGTQFIIVDADEADYPADGDHITLTGVVTIINEENHIFGIATMSSLVAAAE